MEAKFRTLKAHEIECKAVVVDNQIEVSLHTTAAICTKILNETVGPMNWEKEYTYGNKNCIVRIWDDEKERMIIKEDCGGPLTDIDGAKGQASNGFKRVCALGWGLGIELYTQPKILFPRTDDNTIYDQKEGMIVSEKYSVKEIECDEDKHEILRCVIVNSKGDVVYDGPNADGKSNVEYPTNDENDVIIPEDADLINSEEINAADNAKQTVSKEKEIADDIMEDLPDNTDGFEEDFMTQDVPFKSIDYKKYQNELETEIKRTHTKKEDVLKVLGIESFDDVEEVDENKLIETLNKLKARKTYDKK